MNFCYVCSEYPPFRHGGIGSTTQVFGRALAARGHHVRVVGVYPSDTIRQNVEHDDGVEVYRLPAESGKLAWIRNRHHIYSAIADWAKRGEIDAVEVADWEGFAAGWPSLRIPVIARLHGSLTYFAREMNQSASPATCLLESNSFHRADFVSSTSRYTAEMTEKLFGKHASTPKVLYNFVDVPAQPSMEPRSRVRVVYAGSLVEKKGVLPLMRAWNEVACRHPQAELHLYGKDAVRPGGGSMQQHMLSLLSDQARPKVTFHGHVTRQQVAEAFRTCRMAVFPSFSEAFSLVPLEAMAEGCPVVFSKRHSGPELITPGENGLLVEPGEPAEITEAILALLKDTQMAERFSATGARMIRERFSRQALVGQHEAFYESCIRTHRQSASQIRALSRVRLTAHA